MDKKFNIIEISVFFEGKDIEPELYGLFPYNLEEEKIEVKPKVIYGFDDKEILVCNIKLVRNQLMNLFWDSLLEKMTQTEISLLMSQISSRTDDQGHFFIRFDKDALKKGILKLTDEGNCYHIKLSVASYPKTKEKVIEIIEKMLKVRL